MKLNFKVAILLTISFFVISSAFISASLMALGRNQADDLALFKNEFVETNVESFQNSSDLFFSYFDNEISAGKIKSIDDAVVFADKVDPSDNNAIIMKLASREIVDGNGDPSIAALLTKATVDSFVSQWTLDPDKNDFAVDNLDKFTAGDMTVAPARIRVKFYENLGLIVGYAKVFETGKVRVDFIQQQNAAF
jgi:hypothetical protein